MHPVGRGAVGSLHRGQDRLIDQVDGRLCRRDLHHSELQIQATLELAGAFPALANPEKPAASCGPRSYDPYGTGCENPKANPRIQSRYKCSQQTTTPKYVSHRRRTSYLR